MYWCDYVSYSAIRLPDNGVFNNEDQKKGSILYLLH